MYDEIVALLQEGHPDAPRVKNRNGDEIGLDLEEAKLRLLDLCLKNGVYVYLQTPVVAPVLEGRRVTGLQICTPQGLETLSAHAVVDATGDGFVAALAGAPYEVGRADGRCQPATLEFTVDNVDEGPHFACYGGSDPMTLPDGRRYSEVCKEACARGELPENVSIVRIHYTLHPGERSINATQANGFDTLTPEGAVGADYLLRRQVEPILAFLRKYAPGFANCRLRSTATALGVRESRRFVGEYVLSDQDVEKGARFPDVVVHRAWFRSISTIPPAAARRSAIPSPRRPTIFPTAAWCPCRRTGCCCRAATFPALTGPMLLIA